VEITPTHYAPVAGHPGAASYLYSISSKLAGMIKEIKGCTLTK
jgi:hypothetical protein